MSDHEHPQFNANWVFIRLFIFTMAEVLWAMIPLGKPLLWGGLMFFACLKGLLILQYFMHFKYEGWILKCLIAPTPILIAVVVFAITPDVAKNARMDHRITDQIDPRTGQVITIGTTDVPHGEDEGAGH